MSLQGSLSLAERCDLRLKTSHGVRPGADIVRIRLVHLVEIAVETVVDTLQIPLQFGLCEVAVTVVHCLDTRAINSDQLAPVQVKVAAQPYERPKYLPEFFSIVTPELRDRLEVRRQPPKQPDRIEVAMRLRLQPPTRPNTVQIPVDVEFQQIRRIVAWTALVIRSNDKERRNFGSP